jgi:hypothetical protein
VPPTPWPSLAALQLTSAYDGLVELVRRPARDQPDAVSAALARFLVVRASGYVEQVAAEACRAFLESKTYVPQSRAFALSWLRYGVNPTPEHLLELVSRFDGAWGKEFQAFMSADDELLHRELSFLVDRRNKIAHGTSEGIGAAKALELSGHARAIGGWFLARFDPR